MRNSIIEGAFYALMVGFGELYFVADAVRLGASSLALGLVVALPLFVGAIGALASLNLLGMGASRRRVVVFGSAGQVAVYGGLIATDAGGVLTAHGLIALACVYQLCAQIVGVAWSSWFGDLVPAGERGRYFAVRNRVVHTVTCVAALVGGLLLQALEHGPAASGHAKSGTGFAVVFAIAGLARLVSSLSFVNAPEPEAPSLTDARTPWQLMRVARRTLAPGGFARRFALTSAMLLFGVYLASPYFNPHMLNTMHFSYVQYTAAAVAVVLAKITVLPAWGRLLGHIPARSAFLLALLGVALVPMPWLFAHGLAMVIVAQVLSGVSWGGHELSQFAMILEHTERDQRPVVFALVNAANGTAQLTGTIVGSFVLDHASFGLLVASTMILRLVVALAAPAVIPLGTAGTHVPRLDAFLRLAGIRPSGGVAHRALPLGPLGRRLRRKPS